MVAPEDILTFWLDEVGPKGWYEASDSLDDAIRTRFMATWQGAMDGRYAMWLTYPSGSLAYIILLDQFPRNMFRNSGKAFSSDRYSLAAAKSAIAKKWDLRIDPPGRQFFYLPLMHSENLCDQERCVRLMHERMPEADGNLLHARVHREIIRKFGRFPYRNEALARRATQPEMDFIANGGYRETLQEMQAVG